VTAVPSVSVVMPAFNASRFISEAIESVRAQTVPAAEVIVVDDGSDDDTADIADGLGAHVLRHPHHGSATARNAAIGASRGDVLAFLDADDVWLPRKLELQLGVLASDPSADAVSSLVDEFLDVPDGASAAVRSPRLGVPGALSSAIMVRRSVIDRLGPFDAGKPGADWLDWWARARRLGIEERIVPEVLMRRRIHGSNSSATDDGTFLLSIARDHRRRLRAQP
jgi:glycosyltransferase involved in cell wall biosynthesis